MIAGVVLLLIAMGQDNRMTTQSFRMPDLRTCEAAMRAFTAVPRNSVSGLRTEPTQGTRWATCTTLTVAGDDA